MHMMQEPDTTIDVVSAGINLTEFYPSVEWYFYLNIYRPIIA